VTGGRFGLAISDGEGTSLLVSAEGEATETLAVRGDPAAVASVVDFVATTAVPAAPDAELVVRVRDEEQLERALEELDPELLVLAGTLEAVLGLLPDVPAGKLAIAELPALSEDDVEELERAGVDAVIVRDRELL